MLGEYVINHGRITSTKNTVALLAGEEVLIAEQGDYLFVKSQAPKQSQLAGVENTGKVNSEGGSVYFGAGDLYALAIKDSGIIKSSEVKIEGGQSGLVEISGPIDASNNNPGASGGQIAVLGETIAIKQGAQLNASGE